MDIAKAIFQLVVDFFSFLCLMLHPSGALAAENLFLRKQLAFYRERNIKPRRLDAATRLAVLSKNRTEIQVPLTGIIHQFVTARILDHGAKLDFKPLLEHGKSPVLRPCGFIGMPSRKLSGEDFIETLLEDRPCLPCPKTRMNFMLLRVRDNNISAILQAARGSTLVHLFLVLPLLAQSNGYPACASRKLDPFDCLGVSAFG